MKPLHYNTVSPLLHKLLLQLMQSKEFKAFRLVGGTALSLYRGHRLSVDIDLFTDADYGSVNFSDIDALLKANYRYVDTGAENIIGFGKSYFVGDDSIHCVKLDVYYSNEHFIQPALLMDGIRLASIEDIIAMKIDVIGRGGRKKDFWDIHELMFDYPITQMIGLHKKRHPFVHNEELIRNKLSQFDNADSDFDPVCLRNNDWDMIKQVVAKASKK